MLPGQRLHTNMLNKWGADEHAHGTHPRCSCCRMQMQLVLRHPHCRACRQSDLPGPGTCQQGRGCTQMILQAVQQYHGSTDERALRDSGGGFAVSRNVGCAACSDSASECQPSSHSQSHMFHIRGVPLLLLPFLVLMMIMTHALTSAPAPSTQHQHSAPAPSTSMSTSSPPALDVK